MKYDMRILNYLINSFKDVVFSMGKNDSAIAFYKRQVSGLCDIGQLDEQHRLLVYKLLGISGNRIHVNWGTLETNLTHFENIYNSVSHCVNDSQAYEVSRRLCTDNKVSTLVKSLIEEIYPKPTTKRSKVTYSTSYSCSTGSVGRIC